MGLLQARGGAGGALRVTSTPCSEKYTRKKPRTSGCSLFLIVKTPAMTFMGNKTLKNISFYVFLL
jgi:hypothetical protein